MKKRIIKFGIVGLGRGLNLMLDSLEEPHLRLTAICDRNPEKLEEAKKTLAEKNNTVFPATHVLRSF